MVVRVRSLADIPRIFTALEDHLRDDWLPTVAFWLAPKMVQAIQDRITDARFGTNNQGVRAGRGANENADYTLNGDPDGGGVRFENGEDEDDLDVRRSIYGMEDDMYGKAIRGAFTTPLMETGQYLNAFEYAVVRQGKLWQLHPENTVGETPVNDHGVEGPPLWETHEYGFMDSPPRPHIWPGMRDALRENKDEIERMLRQVALRFFNSLQIEVIHA